MRALRIDLEFDTLTAGRLEELRGNDILGPSIRFEGQIAGGIRTIQIPTKKTNTLIFKNDSTFPIGIIVRDADAVLLQSFIVVPDSQALVPIVRQGATIDFLNPDTSLAQVTALFF